MHDASLARALLNQVVEIARDRAGREVLEIIVQIGPLSGVEPLLLVEAFARESAPSGLVTGMGVLTVREVPLTVRCRTCGRESCLEDFTFRCSHCAADEVDVVQGDGLILESVLFREPAARELEKTAVAVLGESS